MPPEWPLVGREEELELVRERLGSSSSPAVILAGDAGVGKTRLALEAFRSAEAAGAVTMRVIATRAAATIPFGAFAHLLPDDASASQARFDLMRKVSSAIKARAGDAGSLLMVDDAHLLDDGSAALVHHLALAGSCAIVATIRGGEPAPDAVTSLWKDALATRVDVHNLSRVETERLLASALGGPMDGGTLKELWDASRGNPLYLRELVHGATESGRLAQRDGLWRLSGPLGAPLRIRELIGSRLTGLDDASAFALDLLAIAEELSFSTLEDSSGKGVIESLERRGLIGISRDGRRAVVRFAHPLYAEVLRERLPATRARAMYATLADAIQRFGLRRRSDMLRVATWRLDAGETAAPELLLEAAEAAILSYDFGLAERLARTAWDKSNGARAGRILGEILVELGRHEEADEMYARLSEEAADPAERVSLVAARSYNLASGLGRYQDAIALLVAEREGCADEIGRARLLSYEGIRWFDLGRPHEALERLTGLFDHPHGGIVSTASRAGSQALVLIGRYDEAVRVSEAGLAAHQRMAKRNQFVGIHLMGKAQAQLESGRIAEAEATAKDGYERALAAGSLAGQANFAGSRAAVALAQGRVSTARSLFREILVVCRELNARAGIRTSLGQVALTSALLGDVATAEESLREADGIPAHAGLLDFDQVERGRAWTAAATGELSGARAILSAAASKSAEAGQVTVEVMLLHDLARLGGAADVAGRLAALAATTDGDLVQARAGHARALAAGDLDGLADAATRFEHMGAQLLAAEAYREGARAAEHAGLGRRATELVAKSRAAAARCEGAGTPALTEVAAQVPLTPREREIAEMAARGLSSKEIAERLTLSTRTVDNHLQRVFLKVGITKREELAAALGRGASTPG